MISDKDHRKPRRPALTAKRRAGLALIAARIRETIDLDARRRSLFAAPEWSTADRHAVRTALRWIEELTANLTTEARRTRR